MKLCSLFTTTTTDPTNCTNETIETNLMEIDDALNKDLQECSTEKGNVSIRNSSVIHQSFLSPGKPNVKRIK